MSLSAIQRSLMPAVILSGMVFSAATIPLVTLRSESVVIQVQDEPIFQGKLDELAVPYLGLATVLSLGAGIASMAVMGWQQSSRKSAVVEEQVSELQRNLKEKEAQIEELKFSDDRLQESNLSFFLQDESGASSTPAATVSAPVELEPQYAVVETATPATPAIAPLPEIIQVEPPIAAPITMLAQPSQVTALKQVMASVKPLAPSGAFQEVANRRTKSKAMMSMPAAQAFTGFTRSNAVTNEPTQMQDASDMTNAAQMTELLSHLKRVMAEIEKLSTAPATASGVVSQRKAA